MYKDEGRFIQRNRPGARYHSLADKSSYMSLKVANIIFYGTLTPPPPPHKRNVGRKTKTKKNKYGSWKQGPMKYPCTKSHKWSKEEKPIGKNAFPKKRKMSVLKMVLELKLKKIQQRCIQMQEHEACKG
jgi:hypothetical protein